MSARENVSGRHRRRAADLTLTFIDSHSQVIRHVVLADVYDGVGRVAGGRLSFVTKLFGKARRCSTKAVLDVCEPDATLWSGVDDLGVRVHSVKLVAVLVGKRQQVAANGKEIRLVLEKELEIDSSMPEEVVGLELNVSGGAGDERVCAD